jgi:hypothetical protein
MSAGAVLQAAGEQPRLRGRRRGERRERLAVPHGRVERLDGRLLGQLRVNGMHGLILSLLQAFYHFVVFLRLWEANNYPEDKNTHKILIEGQKMIGREFRYWKYDKKITEEKNSLKKNIYKIQRKVLP